MQRISQFGFRVNDDERKAIAGLAARLQRSQADAMRFILHEAMQQLVETETSAPAYPTKDEVREAQNANQSQ
jgi:hypothetical protein